jgi:hypothetical protein
MARPAKVFMTNREVANDPGLPTHLIPVSRSSRGYAPAVW